MKKIFRILLIALLLSLVWLLATSCGARKTEINKTKESTKTETSNKTELDTQDESNIKKTENTIVDDKNETVTKETIYEPIDNSKTAIVIDNNGNKTNLDNSKKTVREIRQKNNTKTDITKASEETNKSKESEKQQFNIKSEGKKVDGAKKTERDQWSIWWLLIPAVIIYLIWKNKATIASKIWWV